MNKAMQKLCIINSGDYVRIRNIDQIHKQTLDSCLLITSTFGIFANVL